MDKVNILGVKVSKHTLDSASDKIIEYITKGDKRKCVFTPNSVCGRNRIAKTHYLPLEESYQSNTV